MRAIKCFLSVVTCLVFIQRDVAGSERFEDLLDKWAVQHAKITTLEFHYRVFTQGPDTIKNLTAAELNKILTSTDFTSEREKLRELTNQLLENPKSIPVPWAEAIFIKSGQKIRDDSSPLYVEDGVNRIYKLQHPNHDQIGINGFPGFPMATQNFASFVFDPSLFLAHQGEATYKLVASEDGRHIFHMTAANQLVKEFEVKNGNVQQITTFSAGKPYEIRWFRDYGTNADGIDLPKGAVTAQYQGENGITLIDVKVIDQCTIGLPLDESLFRVSARKGSSIHDFRKPEPRGAALHEDTDDVTVEVFRLRPELKSR